MQYSKEQVTELINSLPIMRPIGINAASKSGTIVAFFDEDHLRASGEILKQFTKTPLVTLLMGKSVDEVKKSAGLRILPINMAMNRVDCDLVICSDAEASKTLRMVNRARRYGREFFWLTSSRPQKPHPDMYRTSRDKIVRIVNGLADEVSVLCYLSRVKGVLHCHPGYTRLSAYRQYLHPHVKPENGDVIFEGGIGGSANSSILFGREVGDNGRVIGFEPVNHLYQRATLNTSKYANIKLENAGLWSEPGETDIHLAEQVSTITLTDIHGDKPTQRCKLTSIDHYRDETGVQPTMIKLDIEGSEQPAIAGAQTTIRQCRPKLQICIYHSVSDFLDIPISIMDANPGYRLYVGHHAPFINECVLYGTAN